MCFLVGRFNILHFSSWKEEQKQVSHVTVNLNVVESILSARGESPSKSSRTTQRISGTSCCVLQSKAVSQMEDILCSKALRKLDVSTGDGERFNKDMLSMTDFTSEDTFWDSDVGYAEYERIDQGRI